MRVIAASVIEALGMDPRVSHLESESIVNQTRLLESSSRKIPARGFLSLGVSVKHQPYQVDWSAEVG